MPEQRVDTRLVKQIIIQPVRGDSHGVMLKVSGLGSASDPDKSEYTFIGFDGGTLTLDIPLEVHIGW